MNRFHHYGKTIKHEDSPYSVTETNRAVLICDTSSGDIHVSLPDTQNLRDLRIINKGNHVVTVGTKREILNPDESITIGN